MFRNGVGTSCHCRIPGSRDLGFLRSSLKPYSRGTLKTDLHVTVESRVVGRRDEDAVPGLAYEAEHVAENGPATRLHNEVGRVHREALRRRQSCSVEFVPDSAKKSGTR